MIGGIVPTRVFRERPGSLPLSVRSDSAPLVRYSDNVIVFNRDPDRIPHLEISLNDFGLETVYGRFLQDKIYSVDTPVVCGVLVDLYV
jgi:hypothetical protein